MNEPILCYIEEDWAYFTTAPLDEQWGDDWGDTPYECNAGEPYEEKGHKITKIAFNMSKYFVVPCDRIDKKPNPLAGLFACDRTDKNEHSVQDINSKKVPWIEVYTGDIKIWAGTTLSEFKKLIRKAGGKVYVEEPEGNGLEKLRRINNA